MVEVVKAGLQDYEAVLEMAKVVWPHTYGKILTAEQLDFMFDMMYSREAYSEQLLLKNHQFLLAKQNGKFTGFASFELNYLAGTAKIHKLYVLPDTQGSGVGKILMSKIENIARTNNNNRITLNVNRFNPAVNFYFKSGFKKAGEEDINIGNGYLMEDYIMVKEL
jgi:ribosomal protein S18 acetylase RimI-like enzyme